MSPTATRCTSAHCSIRLALLPSGPDAVRRLKLHRVRAAVRLTQTVSLSYAAGLQSKTRLQEQSLGERFVNPDRGVKLVE